LDRQVGVLDAWPKKERGADLEAQGIPGGPAVFLTFTWTRERERTGTFPSEFGDR